MPYSVHVTGEEGNKHALNTYLSPLRGNDFLIAH